jgi:hypothetical protein
MTCTWSASWIAATRAPFWISSYVYKAEGNRNNSSENATMAIDENINFYKLIAKVRHEFKHFADEKYW